MPRISAKTAGHVGDIGIRKLTHDPTAQALKFFLNPRKLLDLLDRAAPHYDVRLLLENRIDQSSDVLTLILIVRIGVDDDVGAEFEAVLYAHRKGSCKAPVLAQGHDVVGTGGARDFDGSIRRSIIDDEDFNLVDAHDFLRKLPKHRGKRLLFVETGDLDDEMHDETKAIKKMAEDKGPSLLVRKDSMPNVKSCGVIIPVYNEETAVADTVARVQRVLSAVPGLSYEIVCVNDGSTDGSAKVLQSLSGITLLTHTHNRGYGAALKTAITACRREWIVIVDADGTYPLEELPRLLGEAREGVEMVVGARGGIGIQLHPYRRAARWVLRKMVHVLTGVMVPDLNSGMRVFRRKLYLEFRHLLPSGFSFTTTLTVASLYSGYWIQFVPIVYSQRIGKSNIKPFSDFFGFVMLIVRVASYFEPLRFFLPLAGMLFAFAILRGARDIWVANGIGSLAVITMVAALQVFITGIIADVVVRRSGAQPVDHSNNGIGEVISQPAALPSREQL